MAKALALNGLVQARVKDNSNALQKGINTVLANSTTLRNFFIPKGITISQAFNGCIGL